MFRNYILPRLVWWFYRSLVFTWRIKITQTPEMTSALNEQKPLVFAHWHGDELAIIPTVTYLRLCTMTSTSKDGRIVDYVIHKLGGATSRGSSTRGGVAALKGLVKLVTKEKRPASMAVDGPKGPIYKVKPGVFEVARLTKAQIIPVGAYCPNAFQFPKAWNKTYLPKPFAKVSIFFGPPSEAFGRSSDPKSIELAENLAKQIDDAKQQAMELIEAI